MVRRDKKRQKSFEFLGFIGILLIGVTHYFT
ncbi:membrane protein [Staphylococcus phage S-CoN_Ph11]|nr:membrane protein [Staphylococcus phage S-CoN_Ph11]